MEVNKNKNSDKSKLFLIILINIIIFISLWLLLEYGTYKIFLNDYIKCFEPERRKMSPTPKFYLFHGEQFNRLSRIDENKEGSRPPAGLEFIRKPIILFGCSYTQGSNLKDNETFSYKLSQYTKRPIYNYGFGGRGIQHMLYVLQKGEIYDHIKEPPDYIIYTFISNHIHRLHAYVFLPIFDTDFYYKYHKNYKNELKETRLCNFLFRSYVIKWFCEQITNRQLAESKQNDNFDFMKLHFEESRKILLEKYPDTKFVILKYIGTEGCSASPRSWYIDTPRWKELEDKGFIVISTDELAGRSLDQPQDHFSFDDHPTAAVWDLIVPALAKRLNL